MEKHESGNSQCDLGLPPPCRAIPRAAAKLLLPPLLILLACAALPPPDARALPVDDGSGAYAGALRWTAIRASAVDALLVTETSADDGDSVTAGEERDEHWLKRAGRFTGSVLGRLALYLALLIGLALIPLGLGGTFVMVGAAAIFGLATGFEQITLKLLVVLLALALIGEGIESILGVIMARRYGASKWGMWGAFIGGIAGAALGAPLPVVGNVVGAFIGVFAGAFLFEWARAGRSDSSLRVGWGALVGRTLASAIKLSLGMVIMVLVIARTLG